MADLSPDLSPYAALAKSGQSGVGAMDPGSILGLIQRGRQLQTQSGIADAIRANPNDPTAAYGAAAKNPNVFMGPEDVSNFVHAQRAQSELGQWYMGQAATALGGLLTKPGATLNDWQPIKLALQRYGVPVDMLDQVEASAKGPNGTLDHDSLVRLWNFATTNSGIATRTTKTPGGDITQPAGEALYNRPGVSGTTPPPTPTPTPTPTPQPRPQSAAGAGTTAVPPAQPNELQHNDIAQQSLDSVRRQQPNYGVSGGTSVTPSEEQERLRGASTAQYTQDLGKNYQAGVIPMTKSIELLLKNGSNFTGRGTTEINNIKNFLHTAGIIPDDQMGSVVDFESMKKYMEQFINENSSGGTDARLWQSIAGSPSPDKLQKTNLNLSRVMLGLARMKQVGLDEFQRAGGQPGEYQRWYNNWAKQQDPLAFVWDTMTKEEQDAYGRSHWKGKSDVKSSGLQRFQDSYDAGQRSAGVMGGQ